MEIADEFKLNRMGEDDDEDEDDNDDDNDDDDDRGDAVALPVAAPIATAPKVIIEEKEDTEEAPEELEVILPEEEPEPP
jgi:hypothetical protein